VELNYKFGYITHCKKTNNPDLVSNKITQIYNWRNGNVMAI